MSKEITLPCRRYFEERLLFFIDCKYFANRKLTDDEDKLCDQSIMRASIELKAFELAIEMMEKDGYSVTIEERKFKPEDIVPGLVTTEDLGEN